ncbi:leucine zipper domain-containing protein [Streptomyces sp. NPDC002205]|uniref:leucine zipper domain-containing protein n=1 Tax=Streptomyces sp. NPDC002205 TaxID=3154411 RepID=UPI003327B1F3
MSRQTVSGGKSRYAASGLAGLADRSRRPASCPQQASAEVEAAVVRTPGRLQCVRENRGGSGGAGCVGRGVQLLPAASGVGHAVSCRPVHPGSRAGAGVCWA